MYESYILKKNTRIVNGIFVLIIFLSHSFQYNTFYSSFGKWFSHFIQIDLGQLMVTSFLFYSGYGVFESYKNKDNYIDNFPKHRILATYLKFVLAWIPFLLIYIIREDIDKTQILKSLVLWDSIGNSNWYIFMILFMYFVTYLNFKISKRDDYAIYGVFLSSIIIIIIFSYLKPDYWSNTLVCYSFGMLYSLYRKKIEEKLFKNDKIYNSGVLTVILLFCLTRILYSMIDINFIVIKNIYYNFISVLFILSIVLVSMKIEFSPKLNYMEKLGKYCFWIYILQRIPMMLIKNNNYFVYLFLSFIATCILAIIFDKIYDKLYKKIIKE